MQSFRVKSAGRRLAIVAGGLVFGVSSIALGQAAPQLLPYTMSTYAGANAPTTAGTPCYAGAATVALDTQGAGCLALNVSVGADPHDVRVDPSGNVFYINDYSQTSNGYIARINPYTTLQTVFAGSAASTSACTTGNGDTYGDGCQANDGAANQTLKSHTAKLKGMRGIGTAPNGDLVISGYNDNYIHRVFAATGFMVAIAGNGASTNVLAATPLASSVYETRGVGADAFGNTFIADTKHNTIDEISGETVSNGIASGGTMTALNSTTANSSTTNIPASTASLNAPEDSQIDANGNIFIADQGDDVVRVIYHGGTNFFGIAGPVVGKIYTIAGVFTQAPPTSPTCAAGATTPAGGYGTYNPALLKVTNGVSGAAPATSVAMAVRKVGVDALGNVYIADSCQGVVFFVDVATGYAHVIAGLYGNAAGNSTTPPAALLCPGGSAIGDGCPGPQSSLAPFSDMGTSPDSIGGLYITDNENTAANTTPNTSRLRKLVSGLNFPPIPAGNGSSATQQILVHFAANDTTAGKATVTGSDFTAATPACIVQADATTDCVYTLTFTPTAPGYETAVLTIPSTLSSASFEITGTGTAPQIAFDPGNAALLPSTVANSQGLVLDPAGNAYIADTGSNRILFYNAASGTTSTFAGGATSTCGTATDALGDGCAATAATLNAPRAVALALDGSVLIADTGNNVIRKVLPSGTITLFAGSLSGSVCSQASDATGDSCPALQATFKAPAGIATDYLGQVFVADTGNNVIRQISLSSFVSRLAGGGTVCTTAVDTPGDGCAALQTTFAAPAAIAFDGQGANLYVADTGDNIVRKIYLSTTFTASSAGVASNIEVNPVTLIAGNTQAGSTVSGTGQASASSLNGPTGVAIDAADNVYIADTQNHSIRLVTANGLISTIAGITDSSGTGVVPGPATVTQLNLPAAVAVNPAGTLFIADSGNNRLLSDTRAQVSVNFGLVNVNSSSPTQNYTETNIGNAATSANSAAFVETPTNSQFTLTPIANAAGTINACAPGTFAAGAICNVQVQFNPTSGGQQSVSFTQSGTGTPSLVPTISVSGVGAVLTPTNSTIAQTAPATGNSQFGSSLTLGVTVTAACNQYAPTCYPSGNVTFVVDGTQSAPVALSPTATASLSYTGLAVGQHSVSCNYGGDSFYAGSTCGSVIVVVAQASTTSVLTATNSNQPQFPTTNCTAGAGTTTCTQTTLSATVTSNTTGVPAGTVTFTAGTMVLGTAPLGATGVANLPLTYTYDTNGNLIANTTLAPGTYSLTCTYNGAANFASSTCAGVSFTVLPQTAAFSLVAKGCVASSLYPAGTFTAALGQTCPNPQAVGGVPEVSVADGSTTDVTLFLIPTNTASGTVTFSCSGLPAASACTFSPTSIVIAATSGYATPVYTDVTFFTDVQPGAVTTTAGLASPEHLGWALTLLGFFALLTPRRKSTLRNLRGVSLAALAMLLVGSALTLAGCGGPGTYKANLTPAGTYPVTLTVTSGSLSKSTTVEFNVTAPGIPGQQ